MTVKAILVTGATGKQGGALIQALLTSSTRFHIYALTRNIKSPSALKLAENPYITLIEGDTTKPSDIFASISKPLYGVFSVTIPQLKKSGPTEESQAIPLIDASVANRVQYFIFTSVERGLGNEEKPTYVPHFATKYNIEQHLKNSGLQWTILRPVAFYDNLTPDFFGKGFATMWRQVGNVPIALVSTKDIGVFAAKAFSDPSKYASQAVTLAGDQLTFSKGANIFKEQIGYEMPETFGLVGKVLKWMVGDMGLMFKFFGEGAFAWDMRSIITGSEMMDFRHWLIEESRFVRE